MDDGWFTAGWFTASVHLAALQQALTIQDTWALLEGSLDRGDNRSVNMSSSETIQFGVSGEVAAARNPRNNAYVKKT